MSSSIPGSLAAGPDGRPQAGPARSGIIPALADCFTVRLQTGPGPLDAHPPGQWLVLTGPPAPARPVHDWPGGTGKTQLAVYLAQTWWQRSQAGLLVWLTAASRDSVLSGYLQAATGRTGTVPADDAEKAAARFLSWLAETTQPWLVVLDGVTDPVDLDGLWPDGPAGRVLMTAAPDIAVPGPRDPVVFPVGTFSSHEALTYLMARLSADTDQRLGAVDLAADLGCDPLALAQASAAISSSAITCRDYRDLFLRRREQIAEAAGVQPAAKAVTWALSVERAEQLSPGGLAQLCLALAVLLGCHGIPDAVFATRPAAEFITGPGGGQAESQAVRSALLSLHSTGLLDIDPGGAARMVRVHPAVQAAVRSAMPDDVRDQAARAAADALLQAWPDDAEQSPLAESLRACEASLQRASADTLWAGGAHPVLFRAGQSLDGARLTRPAVSHWRVVARTSERVLGPANPDTLVAAVRLASAALAAGQSDDAVALYRWVVDTLARSLGPDHPRTVAARLDVGSALLTAGRPSEAIGTLEDVLAAGERLHGSGGLDSLAVQDSLASAYQATERYQDAIQLARRTLAERERRYGADHPGTMATRAGLASACLADGRKREAITYAKRTLADRERVLGRDHPDTLASLRTLAAAAYSARRLKEALPLYERILEDQARLHGADHPDTITARGNLASVYHSAGRLAAAIQLNEQTLAGRQRVLGPVHPDTLASRTNLAHAYNAIGRLTEAIALLRETLADCERVLGANDPLTKTVRESLKAMTEG
jgi:tetratricopeptide (TPR) repeat protein